MSEYTGSQFGIISKAKQALLDSTNIESSPDEMKVLNDFLFRCWQMGWLDDYDDSKDVVEVVRCKDCKWWNGDLCLARKIEVVDIYDYCSYGERKGGEEQEHE